MKHLTKEQRYVISALSKRGISKTEIAKELKVHKSSVGRELNRNSSKTGKYNPDSAHLLAVERKERFGIKRKFTKSVEQKVSDYITKEQWSPEQIVGYCKKNNIIMVSVERIYQYIRQDKEKGGLIYKHLSRVGKGEFPP
jgi:IS30 family transposase